MIFSGSYDSADVQFLLEPIDMPPTPVPEREKLIQSGERHYSELLAPEMVPSAEYLELYQEALKRNKSRMAKAIAALAKRIALEKPKAPVIVSLARAGTPIGVLLRRALEELGCKVVHYSISIIHGRGIDENALSHILGHHSDDDIVFVDGWTGKGAIAGELKSAIKHFNYRHGTRLPESLTVLTDLAGTAGLAADGEDYLIPSSILNSVVSGLISRSVLNNDYFKEGGFHGCVFYEENRNRDISRKFVDELTLAVTPHLTDKELAPATWDDGDRLKRATSTKEFVSALTLKHGINDINRVKPGIGEATRAVLRRVPERVILKSERHEDLEHLTHLAKSKSIPIDLYSSMPFQATAIIKKLGQ